MRGFGLILLVPFLALSGVITPPLAAAEYVPAAQGQPGQFSLAGAKLRLTQPERAQVDFATPDGLNPTDRLALQKALIHRPWYAAVALSPAEGLLAKPTAIAQDYHSAAAASAAAMRQCEALREGATPCTIVATTRPDGWRDDQIRLSRSAGAALATSGDTPGALAISQTTPAFALTHVAGSPPARRRAALADCNLRAISAPGATSDSCNLLAEN